MICRDAENPEKPCKYGTVCHELRQRIQHMNDMRGNDCWAFVQITQDLGYPGEPREAA